MSYTYNVEGKKIPALGRTTFNEFKQDSKFNLTRPSYRSGTITLNIQADSIANVNKRTGLGNNLMLRDNFTAADLLGTQFKSEGLSVEKLDNVFDISEKSLSKLTDARVPDAKDFEWLTAEKEKRLKLEPIVRMNNPGKTTAEIKALVDDELKTNPPLGREQRTTLEKRTIGSIGEFAEGKISQKFNALVREVKSGNVTNTADKRMILAELAKVLVSASDNSVVLNELNAQRTTLTDMMLRLGSVNLSYKSIFPADQRRIVSKKWLDVPANKGMFMLYCMSYVPSQKTVISYEDPVFNITRDEKKEENKPGEFRTSPMSIANVIRNCGSIGKNKKFVDLKTRSMITMGQLNFIAKNEGLQVTDLLDITMVGDVMVLQYIGNYGTKDSKGNEIVTLPDVLNMGMGNNMPPGYDADGGDNALAVNIVLP
jgi:hypothetical protein